MAMEWMRREKSDGIEGLEILYPNANPVDGGRTSKSGELFWEMAGVDCNCINGIMVINRLGCVRAAA